MNDRTFNLRELCREADVTERTVRYYIKEGLLPPPSGSGPFSRYTYEHWLRLQFIKRLKDEYLPLSEIKNLLNSRTLPELDRLARQAQLVPSSGLLPKGYGQAQVAPGEPLLSYFRSENGAGTIPASKLLREQMAPASWSTETVPQSVPQAEMASFGVISEPALLDEASREAAPDEPESPKSFPEQVAGAAPPPPPMYGGRPGGAGSPAFQPQAFSRARAAMPPAAGMMAGGAMPAPAPAAPPSPAPMRAMKMSAFAASETPPVKEGTIETASVAPEPVAPPLIAMAAAPVPPPSQEPVTGQTWERIEVAPGVELHIEKRIAEAQRPALGALLQAARRIFGQKEI